MANFNIDYLVVAGGGGGTGAYGNGNGTGAGGAGGLITTSTYGGTENVFSAATGTPYDIVVGAFGAGGIGSGYGSPNNNNRGLNGGNSKFNTAESIGGGGGGAVGTSYLAGANGGSGGGGAPYSNSGGSGTANQGNPGGAGSSNPGSVNRYRGGGGGGASQAGASGDASGNGGNGATNAITVSSGTGPYYAGGGGGGVYSTGVSAGTGGLGGGGNGAANSGNGSSGVANTGSGGGGAGANSSSYSGGNGGSGVVILRYATSDVASYTTTGITPTEDTTTISGQTILSFTTVGTGTITFTAPAVPANTFDGTRVTTPVTGFDKISVTQGLKLPSGTNTNQPTGALARQGMIRNDTDETTGSSASAIEHHNGTNWQYFAATESADPLVYSTFAAWDVGNSISYSGTGNILYNIVNNPNGFNFTKYGGVSYDSTNKSFSFNGATGSNGAYMRFSQNAMNIPTGFTVSMWINPTSFTGDDVLYAYGYTPSLRQFVNSSQMRYYITPGPSGSYTPYFNHGMTTGNWYNITMVINNSNAISPTTIKTYISQEGDSTATLKQTANTNHGAYQNTNQLYFGCNVQNYNSNFNGQLRVMEIYNSELNQTDIDFIVNQGSQ